MAVQKLQGSGYFTFFATQAARGESDIWVGLGQDSAWGGSTPPPSNVTGLPNPIIYKKVTKADLVKAVTASDPYNYTWTSDTTTYYFQTVTEAEAVTDSTRWLYLQADFPPGVGSLSDFDFRAHAFYHNLTPATGYESETTLLPANVDDAGNILKIEHDDSSTSVGGTHTATIVWAIQVGG